MTIQIPELRPVESLVNLRRSIKYDRAGCKLKLTDFGGVEMR